ncbi:ABC transporter, fused inner membrane subunits, partial [mine drainage metagenome]
MLALRWFTAPDIRMYFPAAAAALLQLAIVLASIMLWRAGEAAVAHLGRRWIARGARHTSLAALTRIAAAAVAGLAGLGLASLIALGVWSFADGWPFPGFLPRHWSAHTWTRQFSMVVWPLETTLVVAVLASALALLLVLGCLENEQRSGRAATWRALWLLYVPLLVPQIA